MKTILQARDILRRQTHLILFAALFSGACNILMLAGPLYMINVYDRALGGQSEATLIALSLLMVMAFALMGAFDFLRTRLMARVAARFRLAVAREIRARYFSAAPGPQNWPFAQLDTVHQSLISPGLIAIFDLPWMPIYFAALFLFHPMLGWFALGASAVLIALAWLGRKITASPDARMKRNQREAERLARNIRENAASLRAMGAGAAAFAPHAKAREYLAQAQMRAGDLAGFIAAFSRAFRMIAQSGILGLGVWLTLHHTLSGGVILAASILMGRALAPAESLIGGWQGLLAGRKAWQSLSKWMRNIPPMPRALPLPPPEAGISARDITVVPPDGRRPALRMVSFDLPAGQIMGVTGPAASGKTSLLQGCAGIWPLAGGHIRCGDIVLSHINPTQRAAYFGYCPALAPIFPGSVAENIARLADEPDPEKVLEAARRVGLHDAISELPEGYDTELEEDAATLSLSQRQCLGIARAIYGQPRLLLFDMPDAHLDPAANQALMTILAETRAAGNCAIVTTQRPALLAQCDQALVLEAGQISEYGPAQEVLKRLTTPTPRDVA